MRLAQDLPIYRSMPANDGASLVAVLGPTNTGKTHLAVERMCGHSSGMIGFPLRLLAREVYDRVVAIKGARSVALVTGEEKILPPEARYFLCTVEAMPVQPKDHRSAISPSSRSTRRNSAPIPSAAMSSPTGCCARGGARKR